MPTSIEQLPARRPVDREAVDRQKATLMRPRCWICGQPYTDPFHEHADEA